MTQSSAIAAILTLCLAATPKPVFDNEPPSFKWTEAPKTFEVDVPKSVKRVEVIFVRDSAVDGKTYSALSGRQGLLKVNGAEVVKWLRTDPDGLDVYQNVLNKAEIKAKDPAAENLWIDVTSVAKPGKNEFHYFHRAGTAMGLRIRGWRK